MSKFTRFGHELYTGHRSLDFIGHRRAWYAAGATLVIAALLVLGLKGLNFGTEFTGGTSYTLSNLSKSQATQDTVDQLREKISEANIPGVGEATVATSGNAGITIEVGDLSESSVNKVTDVIKSVVNISDDQISPSTIGASWGKEVAKRAIIGVIVFLVLVMLFIALYFREWKMAAAALVKLFHDLSITIGIYSLSGFSVTPSAVTGFLAILGFSLYDTVVVFDKIRENTKDMRGSRLTYAQAANLAVNQTLVRSINTGLVALIPIGAILWVSAVQLGASSLKDLSLAQFVGMAVGVYSSVCVAPRLLVHMKSGEKEVQLAERRAKARARAVDPYANVPVFTEDMPLDEQAEAGLQGEGEDGFESRDGAGSQSAGPSRVDRPQAPSTPLSQGRIAPPARGPVRDSGAAGRPQPSRKPRSERGK